jgi:RHS repeat-associated protein
VHPQSTVVNNIRFPGQYYDVETGLHYNYHRYYNPKTGRYVTPDPIGLRSGINLYLYGLNNPIHSIDLFGLELVQVGLPGLGRAYVDMSLATKIVAFILRNEASGVNVLFESAFRTTEKQTRLQDDPCATTPAPPETSLHEAGYAFDLKWPLIPEDQRQAVIRNAKDAGFSWGGEFDDPEHFYIEVPGGRVNRPNYILEAQIEYAIEQTRRKVQQ